MKIGICADYGGASIAANKVAGARTALIQDHFSAHRGVEDDNMNLICPGGRVTGFASAQEIILTFLKAEFSGAERHMRSLQRIKQLEKIKLNRHANQ